MEKGGGIRRSKFMQIYDCTMSSLQEKNVSVVQSEFIIPNTKCVGIWGYREI